MRPKRWIVRPVMIGGLVFAAACGEDNVSPDRGATYRIMLQSAPADVGALLLTVQGNENKTVTFHGVRVIPASAQESSSSVTAIIIGMAPSSEVATVVYQTTPQVPPTVQVRAASAGAAGQYRVIASGEVRLSVDKLPQ